MNDITIIWAVTQILSNPVVWIVLIYLALHIREETQ